MEIRDLLIELQKPESVVRDKVLLVEALSELDRMIGMGSLKRAVVDQLLFLLSNIRTKGLERATDGHVLHTLIYGPPGVGKTVVGSILARVWASLGVLGKNNSDGGTDTLTTKIFRDNVSLNVVNKLLCDKVERAATASEATRCMMRDMRSRLFAVRQRFRRGGEALEGFDGDIQKLARLSAEALNYCGMTCQTLQDPLSVLPAAVPVSAILRPNFKVVSRVAFVAGFLGQTAEKTKKLLDDHRGGVLMVDEAYSLYQGERDSFGAEALTVINQYMTEHADNTVIIFAGYKHALQTSVFKVQPGLARRFGFTFEIPGYTPSELTQIFLQQLTDDEWQVEEACTNDYLTTIFTQHALSFRSYGGDTKRFIFQCKLVASAHNWNTPTPQSLLTTAIIDEALIRYKLNQPLGDDSWDELEAQRTYEINALNLRVKELQERKTHEELYERQRDMERHQLERRLREEQERVLHEELFHQARDMEREELRRKVEENKEKKKTDDKFKEPPVGMYS